MKTKLELKDLVVGRWYTYTFIDNKHTKTLFRWLGRNEGYFTEYEVYEKVHKASKSHWPFVNQLKDDVPESVQILLNFKHGEV